MAGEPGRISGFWEAEGQRPEGRECSGMFVTRLQKKHQNHSGTKQHTVISSLGEPLVGPPSDGGVGGFDSEMRQGNVKISYIRLVT